MNYNWDKVRYWRVMYRKVLVPARKEMSHELRKRIREEVTSHVFTLLNNLSIKNYVIGGYWPIRGEIDLLNILRNRASQGAKVALPVVVRKYAPVEFWEWHPKMKMKAGHWDIPEPSIRAPLTPDVLLVPLVGFDRDCYRLGNGGGYYDRTLAALTPKPFTIGVGFGYSALETICPQPHDIPMDVIVTEDGPLYREQIPEPAMDGEGERKTLASSPCFMNEMDPTYFGYLDENQCMGLVADLLELERKCASISAERVPFGSTSSGREVADDLMLMGAHACAILSNAARRINAKNAPLPDPPACHGPTGAPGPATSPHDQISLRTMVSERIRTNLSAIQEPHLYKDLTKVLRIQERALKLLSAEKDILQAHQTGRRERS